MSLRTLGLIQPIMSASAPGRPEPPDQTRIAQSGRLQFGGGNERRSQDFGCDTRPDVGAVAWDHSIKVTPLRRWRFRRPSWGSRVAGGLGLGRVSSSVGMYFQSD